MSGRAPGRGRDETRDEQADRKWDDLLQELRVVQTGTQLIAGFLLTLPFQSGFADLGAWQRWLYLALVVASLVTTALVLTPIAVHRRLSGSQVKPRIVAVGQVVAGLVLGGVALLMVGICVLVFSVVVGGAAAAAAGVPLGLVLVVLLVVVPARLRGKTTS